MLVRMPDYGEQFQCLAGACPHSCCIGWEVVLDEETVERYGRVPGPLGEKLRAAMQTDEEGDVCFPLRGGRCPFLDGENLCEIHRALGQEATSVTCQEHPRFVEDYGPFREVTFSASCPAANALLLGSTAPLAFVETEDGAPCDEGDEWLSYLLPLRRRMMALLADRTHPVRVRLGQFLDLAWEAQLLLDEDQVEELLSLAENWLPRETALPELSGADMGLLGELEVLEPDWREVLRQAETAERPEVLEALLERIGGYFAFRYLLKTVNDGDLLSRAQLCVFCLLAVEQIAAVCGLAEALRRFSREIEHSGENLEALLEALRWGEAAL